VPSRFFELFFKIADYGSQSPNIFLGKSQFCQEIEETLVNGFLKSVPKGPAA